MIKIGHVVSHLESKELMTPEIMLALKELELTDYLETEVLKFGKYKGKLLAEVASFDAPYLMWVEKQSWLDEKLRLKIHKVLATI
jgi:uncharacterized protein (DUF3820 family)